MIQIKFWYWKLRGIIRKKQSENISKKSYIANNVQFLGIKNILIGVNCTIGESTTFTVNNRVSKDISLSIGSSTYIGRDNFFTVGKSIEVGEYCIFGNRCSFICSDHVFESPLRPYAFSGNSYAKSIKIGVNCWLGHDVSVIGNVTIGHGCVIGAKTVITKDIPPFSLVVGNPARILKTFNFSTNNWEKGVVPISSVYMDENHYLAYLSEKFGKLPLSYHSASAKYGHL